MSVRAVCAEMRKYGSEGTATPKCAVVTRLAKAFREGKPGKMKMLQRILPRL